ncbi:MAG: thiamine pyrophosphate-dependent dehydrogenase E1 component subunit alpha [Elusimicrobia bacterium]|nr:thiamine pyrophosphate-dependent dehydrogenase E1 component subunit alpha [Elusimicrobiota bacterium]
MNINYEKIFYQALLIRMAEEKIMEIYPSDKIQSPVHLSVGQEHHITALITQLDKNDQVFTTYRNHAVYLAKGGDLKKMFAELYGKSTGISKGKAGSMHLCSPANNMYGSSAIVASTLSHSVGAAYAFKILGKNNIIVSITGDGSMEEGTFHECLNFASLKKLPILFVIDNNGLAIHADIKSRQSFNLKKLSEAYNISYFKADNGFDMKFISKKTQELTRKIKKDKKPVIFDINTCRYRDHVGVRTNFYIMPGVVPEIKKWQQRDPLITNKILIKKFKNKIEREINEAVKYAEKSRFSDRSELLKDVYADNNI